MKKTINKSANQNKVSIKKLFENYNEDYKPKEIDWGKPVGKENELIKA